MGKRRHFRRLQNLFKRFVASRVDGDLALIPALQPLMSWIVAKKVNLEVLKETRPEKELSSDSEESSAGDGMSRDFHLIHANQLLTVLRCRL